MSRESWRSALSGALRARFGDNIPAAFDEDAEAQLEFWRICGVSPADAAARIAREGWLTEEQ